jgi:hypothetical protein
MNPGTDGKQNTRNPLQRVDLGDGYTRIKVRTQLS